MRQMTLITQALSYSYLRQLITTIMTIQALQLLILILLRSLRALTTRFTTTLQLTLPIEVMTDSGQKLVGATIH